MYLIKIKKYKCTRIITLFQTQNTSNMFYLLYNNNNNHYSNNNNYNNYDHFSYKNCYQHDMGPA